MQLSPTDTTSATQNFFSESPSPVPRHVQMHPRIYRKPFSSRQHRCYFPPPGSCFWNWISVDTGRVFGYQLPEISPICKRGGMGCPLPFGHLRWVGESPPGPPTRHKESLQKKAEAGKLNKQEESRGLVVNAGVSFLWRRFCERWEVHSGMDGWYDGARGYSYDLKFPLLIPFPALNFPF